MCYCPRNSGNESCKCALNVLKTDSSIVSQVSLFITVVIGRGKDYLMFLGKYKETQYLKEEQFLGSKIFFTFDSISELCLQLPPRYKDLRSYPMANSTASVGGKSY